MQPFLNRSRHDAHDRPPAELPEALRALFADARRVELAAGDRLLRQGEAGRELYLVEQGTLDAVVEGADGQEQVLARFGPGALIGEISFLLGGVRSASVRARERAALRARPAPRDDERDGPGFALATLLAQRLRSTNALLQDLLADDDHAAPEPAPAAPPTEGVVEAEALTRPLLRGLIDGHVLALRVPGWFTPRQSRQLCRRLLRHPGFSRYSLAPDVGVQRVGTSFFEVGDDPEGRRAYFELALPTIHELRRVCAPLLLPVDRLRLELDELWPGGAGLASLSGQKMFVGTARLFEDGHSLPPHQDLLARETADPEARRITAQLTANVYLRVPRSGGELALWRERPDEVEVRQYYTGEYDFLDPARLPPPAALLRPQQGELLLMLSDRIHAVRASTGGPRVSMSCFIGHSGERERLVLWN